MGQCGDTMRLKWRLRPMLAAVLAMAGSAFAAPGLAQQIEMSRPVADLYNSVSIYPPSATSMTVCYGFVCRRRHILDLTSADRAALSKILGTGSSSGAAERAAV